VLAPESHSHFDVGPFQVDALTVQKRSKIMRTPERLLPPFRAANLLLCSKYVITFRRFCAAFYARLVGSFNLVSSISAAMPRV
jgi:hypothetical protein